VVEETIIDGELLALYRWRYICIFTFKPEVKSENAFRCIKEFLKTVGAAEGHRISSAASVSEIAWEGPIIHVCVAGIKAAFREHIRAFNGNSGHWHVQLSDLRGGISYCAADTNEHPGVAHFWRILENSPDQVLAALFLSDLHKPAEKLPTWFHALRAFARQTRRLS
jgi:hypothetical protein